MKILGILLVALGLVGLLYGGFHWTEREKVVDLGSVEVTHNERKGVPVSPIAGAVMLAAGIVLIVMDGRGRRIA